MKFYFILLDLRGTKDLEGN